MGQTTTSRRSLLTALAALPVAALPAVAAASSKADAELLGLGATTFDPLYHRWVTMTAADERESYELELAIEAITGVPLRSAHHRRQGDAEETARLRYWQVLRPAALEELRHPDQDEVDAHKATERQALCDALREAAADVLTFDAVTREGLGLQVRAMIVGAYEALTPAFEWDGEPEDSWLHCFLRSVCAFAGVEYPPYRHHVTMLLEREEA
jgi:hypothetical protein